DLQNKALSEFSDTGMLQSTQWIYIPPHFLLGFLPLDAEMR
ncbi:hypothetical protein VCHENC02_0747, partial [Vibrio harveyi]